jgi:two-component system OmpR family response regulator
MNGGRVLVVEDSDLGGRTLKTVLCAAGYEVRWETTGAAGIAAAETWKPDAIIFDRQLPDADGDELAARLQRADQTTPVIVLSGAPRPDNAAHGGRWLEKPVSNRELLDAIEGAGQ